MKRPNPIMIFEGVLFLVFGVLVLAVAGISTLGLFLQSGAPTDANTIFVMIALYLTGLVLVIGGVRALKRKGSYIIGTVVSVLGAFMLISSVQGNIIVVSNILISAAVVVLGLGYIIGTKIGKS